MSEPLLLIESGAIETRAALVRNGAAEKVWFGPALDAEHEDTKPLAGRRFVGRIVSVNHSLNAAFADIGAGQDGFLRLTKDLPEDIHEGALIEVAIAAPPRQSKGAVLNFLGVAAKEAVIGRTSFKPVAREAIDAIGVGAAQIVTDHPDMLGDMKGFPSRIAAREEGPSLFRHYGVDETLSQALMQTVNLKGGGVLHFDETRALVAIDVDTGDLAAASPDRLREKIVSSAAEEICRQIELRNLAGRIVVDFPSIRDREISARIQPSIKKTFSSLPRKSSLNLGRSNFLTLTVERRGQTLWEQTTEIAPDEPAPGRRYKLSWLMKRAVCAVERCQAARPGARIEVRAGADLYSAFESVGDLAERYFSRWGAPIKIEQNLKLERREFEIVES